MEKVRVSQVQICLVPVHRAYRDGGVAPQPSALPPQQRGYYPVEAHLLIPQTLLRRLTSRAPGIGVRLALVEEARLACLSR